MKEPLIEKQTNNLNYYYIFILFFIGFSVFLTCTVYTILIYNDINYIKDSVTTISNIILSANTTKLNSISVNLEDINNCVLHKYCKRVPD